MKAAATVKEIIDNAPTVAPDQPTSSTPSDEPLLVELAGLSPLEYGRRRKAAAEQLGVELKWLDLEIARRRPKAAPTDEESAKLQHWDVTPWGDEVDSDGLLNAITAAIVRYVILPEHAAEATALWILHAWTIDAFHVSPLLAIRSPEKRCGKSTLLNVIQAVVPRPLPAASISPSATFRAIEKWQPCLLVDEADTFLEGNHELRGILNSGWLRASAAVIRAVESDADFEPRVFKTWTPKVIAKIGRLHETLADRSIDVCMQRKPPGRTVAKLKPGRATPFDDLRRMAARWAADNLQALGAAEPTIPDGLNDRAQDNWAPLLAIADLAGGDWPRIARTAAAALSGRDETDASSLRVQLLGDVREVFAGAGDDNLSSALLVTKLTAMDDRPWQECRHGKPLNARQLASMLGPFGIGPRTVRLRTGETSKGYVRGMFEEAWTLYLPPQGRFVPSQRHNPHQSSTFDENPSVTNGGCDGSEKRTKPSPEADCDGVTFSKRGEAEDIHPEADDTEVVTL